MWRRAPPRGSCLAGLPGEPIVRSADLGQCGPQAIGEARDDEEAGVPRPSLDVGYVRRVEVGATRQLFLGDRLDCTDLLHGRTEALLDLRLGLHRLGPSLLPPSRAIGDQ